MWQQIIEVTMSNRCITPPIILTGNLIHDQYTSVSIMFNRLHLLCVHVCVLRHSYVTNVFQWHQVCYDWVYLIYWYDLSVTSTQCGGVKTSSSRLECRTLTGELNILYVHDKQIPIIFFPARTMSPEKETKMKRCLNVVNMLKIKEAMTF